jgi:hypothetical protein
METLVSASASAWGISPALSGVTWEKVAKSVRMRSAGRIRRSFWMLSAIGLSLVGVSSKSRLKDVRGRAVSTGTQEYF